ncbi:MAG: diadenylate cyclase CdaA [Thermodesulfobacteriota bacterium]
MNEIVEILSLNFSSGFSIRDIIDMLVITFIFYKLITLLQTKRALQMIFGLFFIFVIYIVSGELGIFTINWVLGEFLSAIIVIIVVLFQSDIRKALTSIGRGSSLQRFFKHSDYSEKTVDEVVKAANFLANNKIGAIIAMERANSLADAAEGGIVVNTTVSAEILISIFNPGSPLHDGGVIVQGNKITSAGCFFPIDTNPDIPNHFGTRHRAAFGLSNETDAAVVVVSEERGEISLMFQGEGNFSIDVTALRGTLIKLLGSKPDKESGEKQ